jgi:hypothetical protein
MKNETIDITTGTNITKLSQDQLSKNELSELEGQPQGIKTPEIFQSPDARFYSSIPQSDRKTAALLIKALTTPTAKIDDIAKTHALYLKHVVAHDVTISTDTGDVEGVRVVLIMEDNSTIAGVSIGLKEGLSNIMMVVGKPPYNPALPLVIMPVKTRRGFNTFNILIADEDNKLIPFGKLETK